MQSQTIWYYWDILVRNLFQFEGMELCSQYSSWDNLMGYCIVSKNPRQFSWKSFLSSLKSKQYLKKVTRFSLIWYIPWWIQTWYLSSKYRLWQIFGSSLQNLMNSCMNACQNTEAIIYSQLILSGYHIAEKLGVPGYASHVTPQGKTSEKHSHNAIFELNSQKYLLSLTGFAGNKCILVLFQLANTC